MHEANARCEGPGTSAMAASCSQFCVTEKGSAPFRARSEGRAEIKQPQNNQEIKALQLPALELTNLLRVGRR